MNLDDFLEEDRKPIRPGKFVRFMRQTFYYAADRKELFFRIRVPYYSAGKQYHWPGSCVGLGLNKEALYFALRMGAKIGVFVEDKKDRYYQARPSDWKAFADKWGSIELHGTALIYVLQWGEEHFRTVMVKNDDEKDLETRL